MTTEATNSEALAKPRSKTLPRSSEQKLESAYALLPDALVEALASVIADVEKEGRKDLERLDAQHRAVIAELQNHYRGVEDTLIAKVDALERQVNERVQDALSNVKDGKDGRDGIDGKDGAPGKDGDSGKPGERGEKGEPGRDGLAVVDFLRGDNGHLIITLSDGSTKDMGQFVGKDGAPGANGVDGKDGRDGKDGLNFEDWTAEFDEESKTLRLWYARGDVERESKLFIPIPLDRGTFQAGAKYSRGDGVTCRGCWWIAQKDNPEGAPGNGSGEWRLAVKAGRDGKNGDIGPKGEKGDPGRPGRDLTQLGSDGAKW